MSGTELEDAWIIRGSFSLLLATIAVILFFLTIYKALYLEKKVTCPLHHGLIKSSVPNTDNSFKCDLFDEKASLHQKLLFRSNML